MESGRDEDLLKKEMVVVCGSKMPNMCDVTRPWKWASGA